jgi:hypothetical protein
LREVRQVLFAFTVSHHSSLERACVSFGPVGIVEHSQEVQSLVLLLPSYKPSSASVAKQGSREFCSPLQLSLWSLLQARLLEAPGPPYGTEPRAIVEPPLSISVLLSFCPKALLDHFPLQAPLRRLHTQSTWLLSLARPSVQ